MSVTRVSADLPFRLTRYGRAIAQRIPGHTVRGDDAAWLIAARDARLRRLPSIKTADVVIGMGSSFGYHIQNRGRRLFRITYEDMTVAQSNFPSCPAKDRWINRQRRLYSDADLCCASTPWVADSINADYCIPRSKIVVAGLGANIWCEPRLKDWTTPNILWVGVEWERKGGDILLEAFTRARLPNATLNLVGRHPHIDLPGVQGHGIVRDEKRLRSFFEEATLFALPSRFDPSPIVFLEAASAGTPCIGTETAGLAYNVGPSGVVVPPGDVAALIAALTEMTVPEVAARYSEAALAHARRHSWEAVAGRIMDAVEDRWHTQ